MESDLASECRPFVDRVLRDLETATGIVPQVELHLVTPDEQAARDAERDQLLARAETDPTVTVVQLGSGPVSRISRPGTYESYWELRLPSQSNMVHDAGDIVDTIQEWAIEELWSQGRSASWPECPVHGGHPLQAALGPDHYAWVCPNDLSIEIEIGHLEP